MRRRSTTTMAAASVVAAAAMRLTATGDATVSAAAYVAFIVTPSTKTTTTAAASARRQQQRPTTTTSMMGARGGRGGTLLSQSTMLARNDDASSADKTAARLLLDEAFSNLDDSDKYETVLAGLCAKIVDNGSESDARSNIVDPMRLLGEMNSLGISMGPRGVVGLIDATALSSDARIMADVLSLARRNGAISRYGSLQGDVDPVPRYSPSSSTAFAFGGMGGGGDRERKMRRLASLPPVPDDERAAEVSQAVLFASTIATCAVINAFSGPFGLEDLTPWTNLVIGISVSVVLLDNFFDAIFGSTSLLVRMNEDRLPDALSDNLRSPPNKEEMPLGLGTGKATGSVMRGFGRLLSDDTERDSMCEAAAVYAAYGLGLPCFAFRPNAKEGAALVLQSMEEAEDDVGGNGDGRRRRRETTTTTDGLASDVGLLKVLIWLMAPVAMEISKHPQLLSSEPREASGFLDQLAKVGAGVGGAGDVYPSALSDALPADDGERDAYLRWALAEADSLLRRNAREVEALSGALAGGAATVGDCVAILEGW